MKTEKEICKKVEELADEQKEALKKFKEDIQQVASESSKNSDSKTGK